MDWCQAGQLDSGDVFVGEDGRVLTMQKLRTASGGQVALDCFHGAGSVSLYSTTLLKRPEEIVLRLAKGKEEIPHDEHA